MDARNEDAEMNEVWIRYVKELPERPHSDQCCGQCITEANRCHLHKSGVHEPDLTSITRDPRAPAGVVDVNCVNCGRSGAVRITTEEVDW